MILLILFTVVALGYIVNNVVIASIAGGKLMYDKYISHRSMKLKDQRDCMIYFSKAVFAIAIWLFILKAVNFIIC